MIYSWAIFFKKTQINNSKNRPSLELISKIDLWFAKWEPRWWQGGSAASVAPAC